MRIQNIRIVHLLLRLFLNLMIIVCYHIYYSEIYGPIQQYDFTNSRVFEMMNIKKKKRAFLFPSLFIV